MSDEVWRREAVESPCIKLCVVHPEARLCLGCYRTIEEIAAWGRDDARGAAGGDGRTARAGAPGEAGAARRTGGAAGRGVSLSPPAPYGAC